MVVVPAGTARLGSHEMTVDRKRGERPYQTATIKRPFAIARTEVTVGQYRTFVEASGHRPTPAEREGRELAGCNYFDGQRYGYVAGHSWRSPGYPQRDDDPVVCVSWSDAKAYAGWLSDQTGRAYRVPSAVEFEYASRAGTDTVWFWGNESSLACDYANIADQTLTRLYPKRPNFSCDDGFLFTAGVASFKANPFGLHDMVGNVWEWTDDCWHDDLSQSPLDGSPWHADDGGDCQARVPKGGSWISGIGWARAATRSRDGQHYRSFMLGFRVAADARAR